ADHDRVGPGGQSLAHVAAGRHAAVRDDRHVPAGLLQWKSRAAAASAVAVTCGTPRPSTSRLVHAAPGPTPISSASAPTSIRPRHASYVTTLPITSGIASDFLSLRKSTGVYSVATCRAVVTVDWTTKMSAPASCAIWPKRSARCGIDDTTAGPPPFLISRMRWWISSSLIGSL